MDDLIKKIMDLPEDKLSELISSLSGNSSVCTEKSKDVSVSLSGMASATPQKGIIPAAKRQPGYTGLSYAQRRLWFLQQMDPGSPYYSVPCIIRLTGSLRIEHLEKALNEIVFRHEILRSSFYIKKAEPRQKISPYEYIRLEAEDIRGGSAEEKVPTLRSATQKISRILHREIAVPFRLSEPPLFRFRLFFLNKNEHVLLLNFHHIICDGWSLKIFARELSEIYTSLSSGRPQAAEKPEIQYSDYSLWQKKYLKTGIMARQVEYWSEYLKGMPQVLNMPFGKDAVQAKMSKKTSKGARLSFMIPEELSRRCSEFAAVNGVTVFSFLLSAFGLLLYKYSAQEDFGIGITAAGRNHSGLENLIGFFINTMVVRFRAADNNCVETLIRKVSSDVLNALDNQDLPFDRLVQILRPERATSQTPLFQVMFDYQHSSLDQLKLPGLSAELLSLNNPTAKFDLLLSVEQSAKECRASIEYNTAKFSKKAIERLASGYLKLLENMISGTGRSIADISCLSMAETAELTGRWKGGSNDYNSGGETLVSLFEKQAQLTPDRKAVICRNKCLTFRELNRKANHLAHYLIKAGAGPDRSVGIMVNPSLEQLIGILAILKSGAAYLPLDPSTPAERLSAILSEVDIGLILGNKESMPGTGVSANIIDTDLLSREISRQPSSNPPEAASAGDTAYIIFTSGSTGKPKGVMIEHRSAVLLLNELTRLIYIRYKKSNLRIALNSPLVFDASVLMWVTMLRGYTIIIVPEEARTDPHAFIRLLEEYQIDVMFAVPTQLKLLLDSGLHEHKTKLSTVLFGGEAIDGKTWKRLSQFSGVDFFNLYGPTENTVIAAGCLLHSGMKKPVIGPPLKAISAYILDNHLNPTPPGNPGELVLSGRMLARGYINNPAFTAERFVPNPYSESPGERLYRTGDMVRVLDDGNMEFIGRKDNQIKLRGFRIELEDIEINLREHPSVTNAAVKLCSNTDGSQYLCAYYSAGRPVAPGVLRNFLRQRLSDYMIPACFIQIKSLPLTPGGKPDRKLLPEPFRAAPVHKRPEAGNILQMQLAEMWRKVLKTRTPGINENFFELGGDSIKAAVFINMLREKIGRQIAVSTIFLYPTILQLSRYLRNEYGIRAIKPAASSEISASVNRASANTASANTALENMAADTASDDSMHALRRTTSIPLSFAQQRLWFFEQLESKNPLYNISAALEIKGSLDTEALRKSLGLVIRRHEILRSSIQVREGQAYWRTDTNVVTPLSIEDISGPEFGDADTRVAAMIETELQRPFDLSVSPLMRVLLIRTSEFRHVLVFSIHHIIADAWSVGIFISELNRYYAQYSRGKVPVTSALPVQYADYILWQRKQSLSGELKQHIDYWKKRLTGVPPKLNLPTDRPRPGINSYRGSDIPLEIPEELLIQLKHLSGRRRTTLFVVMLSAIHTLLYRYSGQEDICIGTPVANRNHRQLEKLIGLFLNTLVMRADLSGDPRFAELIDKVKLTAEEAFQHQEAPFEKVLDEISAGRDLSIMPVFQVLFSLQNTPDRRLRLGKLSLKRMAIPSKTAKFDITISLEEQSGRLRGIIEYNSDLFSRSTIEAFAGHLIVLLESIVDNPDEHISRLNILPPKERAMVLGYTAAENSSAEAGVPECIHSLFETAAERYPGNCAVVCANGSLTYSQLNSAANQLASFLINKGVRAETAVGLCMHRTKEMLISILAILKAGGAYIPIDPDSPEERLNYILDDSQVEMVITSTELEGRFTDTGRIIICPEKHSFTGAAESTPEPPVRVHRNNLAYIIYTSGSTGRPKGVLVEHSGIVNLVRCYISRLGISPGMNILQFFPCYFDGSVADIFTALSAGATLYIPFQSRYLLGDELRSYMQENGITTAILTPSVIKDLGTLRPSKLSLLVSAGEACNTDTAIYWGGELKFFNAYGPTEATVAAAVYQADDLPPDAVTVPVGRPLRNTSIYILDSRLQLLPAGVPGEICISGTGVARGYLGKPAMTAERFLPDPYSPVPGSRMYRSGDLGRLLIDGNIEFLGRMDDQIKLNGYRIEPGEVRSAILKHPDINDACVIYLNDEKRLAAYYSTLLSSEVRPGLLRSYLKDLLPEYMIPSFLTQLEALPYNESGKIDRSRLPKSEIIRSEKAESGELPLSEKEEILRNIWEDVLKVRDIGTKDNFFELGGDSILSIQVVAKAREAGIPLTVKQIFQNPTISELAASDRTSAPIFASGGTVSGELPLTPIQQWFFEGIKISPDYWNQSLLLLVNRKLNVSVLQQAVIHVAEHHDSFRLRFRRTNGSWIQYYADERPDSRTFTYFDLEGILGSDRELAFRQNCADMQKSLNLEKGPLLRTALTRFSQSEDDRLFIVAHHLIMDNLSWRILLEDLYRTYLHIEKTGRPDTLSKGTSYKYWSLKLNEYSLTEEVSGQIPFWQSMLSEECMQLISPAGQPENEERYSATEQIILDEQMTSLMLRQVNLPFNTNTSEIILAALCRVLARWTGRENLLINYESHGREEISPDLDISRTIGWFTNLVPVMIKTGSPSAPAGSFILSVKEQLRAALSKGLGFGILKYISRSPVIRGLQVPQVSFNYLGNAAEGNNKEMPFAISDEPKGDERHPEEYRRHVFDISALVVHGRLRVYWSYSTRQFSPSLVGQLLASLRDELIAMTDYCVRVEESSYSSSDFDGSGLNERELKNLMSELDED